MSETVKEKTAQSTDLTRRARDLKLTCQLTTQSLPSLRLVHERDKSLIAKISSARLDAMPFWATQLARRVTIRHSDAAAKTHDSAPATNPDTGNAGA